MRFLLVVLWSLALGLPAADAEYSETDSRGAYLVPTTDPSLLPYAQFDVPRVRVKVEGQNVEIRYPFPKALAGQDLRVELSGEILSDEKWVLRGEAGVLTCNLVEGFRVCVARYDGMPIDKASRDAHILNTSRNADERSARLKIAALFGGELEPQRTQFHPLFQLARLSFFDGERIGVLRFQAN